jgi:ketosteroid isomerase-like protein
VAAYYEHMFAEVETFEAEVKSEFQSGDETVALWTMTVKHGALEGGKAITVDGVSYLKFENGKAVHHHAYYDGAALVYEHVPVVGFLVGMVKDKVAGN